MFAVDVRSDDRVASASPRGRLRIFIRLQESLRRMGARLTEPKLSREDDRRKEHVFNIILVGSIAMVCIFAFLVYQYALGRGGDDTAILITAISLFFIFFLGLYWLSRKGFVALASYAMVGAFLIGNGYAAYRWGVMVPTILVGYALLAVIAGMVVGSRFGFFVALGISLYTVPVWWAQDSGVLAVDAEALTVGDAVSVGGLYVLIMTVAWLSKRELERSLVRARASERALAEHRDRLEVEVEKRTRELRETQFAEVEQLSRFAEFGQMASGLFHDLVNVFNAALLEMQRPGAVRGVGIAEARERLATAGMLTDRVNDFIEATRKQLAGDGSRESFSVVPEIGQVVQFLSFPARRRNVRVEVIGDNAVCFGNCFKFHQAMMNLILNAIESYGSEMKGVRRNRAVVIAVEGGNRAATITVTDHGAGIPDDTQRHIFKPFFTTKRGGKGMGLGLAIVKKIIENEFRGTLHFTSTFGKGSSFTVRMSLAQDSPQT
jgi:signal transduction histidine kinase